MMGQPSACVLAMKMYEEHMKLPHSMDSETSPVLMDPNRMALLKSATNHQGVIKKLIFPIDVMVVLHATKIIAITGVTLWRPIFKYSAY
ncbi:unnamed protein product [Ilex paraguariensis]